MLVSYGGVFSEGDGVGFLRSLDSILIYLGLRSVYDFVDVSKWKFLKCKRNVR